MSSLYLLFLALLLLPLSHQARLCSELPVSAHGENQLCINGVCFNAFCDQQTAGGGWLVTQHRYAGSVHFNRSWSEYVQGFGSPTGEQWLGLRYLKEILDLTGLEFDLMIELGAFWDTPRNYGRNGTHKLALYHGFKLTGSE